MRIGFSWFSSVFQSKGRHNISNQTTSNSFHILSNLLFTTPVYGGVLVSLWLFLFAAQPKEFFLYGLKKLEQRSHKCVELRGEYVE
jgi:hypothetical protein